VRLYDPRTSKTCETVAYIPRAGYSDVRVMRELTKKGFRGHYVLSIAPEKDPERTVDKYV
jgi:hypothetical protein